MNLTHFKITTIILFLLTISFSININSQELIPLKVNNEWKYIEKETINGKTTITDTITSNVVKTATYNNKKWFYLNELGDTYLVRNNKQGQYELDTLSIQKNGDFKEVLMFKRNFTLEPISYIVFDDIKVNVESGTTQIKIEIGNFDCIKYSLIPQEAKQNEVIEFYFKPGIGLIYHKWIEKDIITTYELIEFNIE